MFGNIHVAPRLVLTEMHATKFETREIANNLNAAVGQPDFARLLGVGARCQRFGIGLFEARTQGCRQRIEHRQHFNRVGGWLVGLATGKPGAVMQRVEQADQHEGEQHRRRRHSRPAAPYPSPRRTQQRIPGRPDAKQNGRQHQQPDQRIGPEQDGEEVHRPKRIRGSTSV